MTSIKPLSLLKSQRGAAIVEFAVLFPVFLILTFAIIGFGYLYVVYEAEGKTVTAVAQAISTAVPPADPTSWPPITWSQAAAYGAAPLIAFPVPDPKTGPAPGQSTICGQSYATLDEAQAVLNNAKACDKDVWNVEPPATGWTRGSPWYVVVQAKVTPNLPFPGLYAWMVNIPIKQTAVATVMSSTAAATTANPWAWVTVNNTDVGDPNVVCQSNGYNYATGACNFNYSYGAVEPLVIYTGTLSYLPNSGQPMTTCTGPQNITPVPPDPVYTAKVTFQIFCQK